MSGDTAILTENLVITRWDRSAILHLSSDTIPGDLSGTGLEVILGSGDPDGSTTLRIHTSQQTSRRAWPSTDPIVPVNESSSSKDQPAIRNSYSNTGMLCAVRSRCKDLQTQWSNGVGIKNSDVVAGWLDDGGIARVFVDRLIFRWRPRSGCVAKTLEKIDGETPPSC
jgi:hypothetical protein